jgi:hypothetical protein
MRYDFGPKRESHSIRAVRWCPGKPSRRIGPAPVPSPPRQARRRDHEHATRKSKGRIPLASPYAPLFTRSSSWPLGSLIFGALKAQAPPDAAPKSGGICPSSRLSAARTCACSSKAGRPRGRDQRGRNTPQCQFRIPTNRQIFSALHYQQLLACSSKAQGPPDAAPKNC